MKLINDKGWPYNDIWKHHPVAPFSELVSCSFLYSIRNPNSKREIENKNKQRVSFETFKKELEEYGMTDPLVIGVDVKNKRIKLETGNHRIQLFYKLGVSYIPATCFVDTHLNHHFGNDDDYSYSFERLLWDDLIEPGFCKPSDILPL